MNLKRFFSPLALLFMAGTLSAQTLSVPFSPNGKKIASLPAKPKIHDKTTQTYLIDYEAYDYFLNGNDDNKVQRSISDVLFYRTDSFQLTQAYVAFDSLILTTDYSDFIPYGDNEFTNMVIDTIYAILWHGKASPASVTDTLEMSILAVSNGRPNENNVLATETITLTNSLSQPATSSGYPLDVVAFGFNYSLSNTYKNSFAVRFRFKGAPQDTVYLLYSWPSTGNQCGSFTGVKDIVVASVYPNSFYRVYIGAAGNSPTNIFPRTDGAFVWYLDCNGNGTPWLGSSSASGWDQSENIYQHWAIWARVTLTSTASVEEVSEQGIAFRLMPNPAEEEVRLSLTAMKGGVYTLSVRDVAGRTVMTRNLGSVGAGETQFSLDLSALNSGLYTLTVEGNGVQSTRSFVRK